METNNEPLIDQVQNLDPLHKVGDKISEYYNIRKNAKVSLGKIENSIEKFSIKYPWFGIVNELILKVESEKSWKSVLSDPNTEGFFTYFSSFINERTSDKNQDLSKQKKMRTRTQSKISKGNQMITLWDKYKCEFIRIGLEKLNEKYRILLNLKQKYKNDIEKINEIQQVMDEFTGIYETKIEENHEKIKILQEASVRLLEFEKNFNSYKFGFTDLLSENSLALETQQKTKALNEMKKHEALDIDLKENCGVSFESHKSFQNLPYPKNNTREKIEELRNLYLSNNVDSFNNLFSQYILIDPFGLKKALNHCNYEDLTNFNPFLDRLPESSTDAENLTPREPNFYRRICEWEDQINKLPWETRLIFPHLTVYDICSTLSNLKKGKLNLEFTIKYLPQYPWLISTLTTPPDCSLSFSQQSYLKNLLPNSKIMMCSESNSTIIQIFRDNLENVLFSRSTKFYKKDQIIDFRYAILAYRKKFN